MSIVVSIYTNSAFWDYLLPAVNNTNYDLILKGSVFNLEDDIVLNLEIVDGSWNLLKSDEYRIAGVENKRKKLENGDIFNLETSCHESISCMVKETEESFCVFEKYDLSDISKLTIGSAEDNDIQYQSATFVSKHHATLQRVERGFAIRDTSRNGTFINYLKIDKTQPLYIGDCINIFGLKIVYLGNAIAVSSTEKAVLKINVALKKLTSRDANAEIISLEKRIFHRAPRFFVKPETEAIEIEGAPTPKSISKKPLWMTIGPSFTMVIPMLLGSAVAIVSAESAGTEASLYMFTGIFTAASSAIVGAFWAVTNIRYAGKEAVKEEKVRKEAYGAYLEEREGIVKKYYDKYKDYLENTYPEADKVANYDETDSTLWNRNRRHEDFLSVRVGLGETEFPVEISIPKRKFSLLDDEFADAPQKIKEKYKSLHSVPVMLDLCANRLFGIVGGKNKLGCYEVMKAITAQIAACNCYTDVKLVLIYDKIKDEGNWDYVYWLPHVWSEDKKTRYIASNKTETRDVCYELLQIFRMRSESESSKKTGISKPFYVIIIANPELLEGEPIAKYVYNAELACGLTAFFLADSEENLPNECENIIKNNVEEQSIYNVNQEKIQKVKFDKISDKSLEKFSRRILSIQVNEIETGKDVPNSLTFFEMYGVRKLEEFNVVENWKKNRTYETMKAMIGVKAGEIPCYLDIHEKYHGPHGLVAGTTGSGKSETLQTYMLSLALSFSPDDIGYFIIDFKGGGMAGLFDGLPHLIGSISNLSGNQVRRAMISIKSENKRRQKIFMENNVNNINSYTKLYKNGEVKTPLPHMFIIVDEFAELKREEPEFMKELISVAQVGRSLGVHLILSTQKPSGTVDDNIWSNSKFRLCLRVQDKQDSNDMLHKPDAAYITQTGRGYLQVGNDEVYELFQSGYSGALYDAGTEGVKSEVVSMITTTGKTSLTGNHQKRLQQERARHSWIKKLVMCIVEAAELCKQDMDEFSRNDNRIRLVYERIESNNIAFEKSDYNKKRMDALIGVVTAVVNESQSDTIEEVTEKVLQVAAFSKLKLPEEKKKTQLDAIVEYLADIAKKEGYVQQMQLWLPPLPDEIYLNQLEDQRRVMFDDTTWGKHEKWTLEGNVGLTDDPENQAQLPLSINFAESGNIAVVGSVISGKSTFLQTLLYEMLCLYSPEWINFYALDFSSHMLSCFAKAPHFGGVLYEDDSEKIDKLFFMLDTMTAERKKIFSGGNYVQYVKAHGIKLPMIIVIIDNLGTFREKTDGQYDDKLIQLIKEGTSYGIQFLVTAAGFSTSEINSKMADCFKTTFTLQLNDKYSYCEALRTNQIEVLPEHNVKGRGLANVDGAVLEYQTALAFRAEDDYHRLEKIEEFCEKMQKSWNGSKARMIPFIPEKPLWSEFENLDAYKQMIFEKRYLPVGYELSSASVYGIDLAKSFVYLVSGKARTGKTTMQKAVMQAAKAMKGRIVVIEHMTFSFKSIAETMEAEYIAGKKAQADFFSNSLELIKSRNQKKRMLMESGKDEMEIFEAMKSEQPIFIIISDIVDFVQSVCQHESGITDIRAFVKNVFEKGRQINLFFFVGINQDTISGIAGNDLYLAMTAYREGMHFGGVAEGLRYMDFGNFTYNEKNKLRKAGIAMLPTANGEEVKEVVIPLNKR